MFTTPYITDRNVYDSNIFLYKNNDIVSLLLSVWTIHRTIHFSSKPIYENRNGTHFSPTIWMKVRFQLFEKHWKCPRPPFIKLSLRKNGHIRSFSGPHSVMRENADQKNSKYGNFLRSVWLYSSRSFCGSWLLLEFYYAVMKNLRRICNSRNTVQPLYSGPHQDLKKMSAL